MLDAYIYDGIRSPIGRHAGKLAGLRPDDLAGEMIAEVVKRNGVKPEDISDVILGCVTQAGGGLTGSGASACLQTIHEVHIARANVRVWTGLQAGS